jgi:hypothetical protein
MEPSGGVWGTLLGAPHISTGTLMLHAACHLFELELDNLGKYLLMSNTFALAGRWGDVSRVRKAIK